MLSSWPGVPSSPLILRVTLGLYFSSLAASLLFCIMEESEGMISKICVSPFSFPLCFFLPSFMFCLFVCSFVHSWVSCLTVSYFLPSLVTGFRWSHPHPGVWKLALTSFVVAVQSFSRVWLFVTAWTTAHQVPSPSPSPRACSISCPLSRWCHPTISSSVSSLGKPNLLTSSQLCGQWCLLGSLKLATVGTFTLWNSAKWQITPSARSQLLNNSSTPLLWPLSEQSLGINNLLLVKITMKETSLIIQLWKSSSKLHIWITLIFKQDVCVLDWD